MGSDVDHQVGLCKSGDGLTEPATASSEGFCGRCAVRVEACMGELSGGRQLNERPWHPAAGRRKAVGVSGVYGVQGCRVYFRFRTKTT